jgi:tetratricopeptide (TPR) repeat protein
MNPEQNSANTPVENTRKTSIYETISFYALLVTTLLVPIAFLPTQYIALDLIKSLVIAFGTIIAVLSIGWASFKERKLVLPPRNITWASTLLILSLIISSLMSSSISKALLGQGFETGTASSIALLFVAALVAFNLVYRRVERGGLLYAALAVSFIILALFHALRFIFGVKFAPLSILGSLASTFFGSWSSLGVFSLLVGLLSLCALLFLPLSKRMRIVYWIITAVALCAGVLAYVRWSLIVSAIVLIGITAYQYLSSRVPGSRFEWKRLVTAPSIGALFFILVVLFGAPAINKIATAVGAEYTEFALSWQLTLDVASGAIKSSPLFGVGPNHFGQAFLTYKPLIINTTDLWGIEFNSGVGAIPTFFVTQGILGTILWLIIIVFIGLLGRKIFKNIPAQPYAKFILVSSYVGTVFSWLILLAYSPSHAFLYSTFILTGICYGAAAYYGNTQTYVLARRAESGKVFQVAVGALLVIALVWGLVYVRKTIALAYFASGVKHLTAEGDPQKADLSFATAAKIDPSDIYWQARAEAGLVKIRLLAQYLSNSSSPASSTEIAAIISGTLDQSLSFAGKAIELNPTNYYNHLSAARVSEMAMNFKVQNAYESAIKSYTDAIALNPYNPSLYLNVARVEAAQGKYDNALGAIGTALQVKRNYTDAAFMASQVAATQGNVKDAITAARVSTQLSPNNPIVFFQLGILLYTDKDYAGAAEALSNAVRLQSDYANARYFLGLTYARLGKMADATAQFDELNKSNPGNQEVQLILSNLKAGKSPFENAPAAITPAPEKRSSLPLKDPEPKDEE